MTSQKISLVCLIRRLGCRDVVSCPHIINQSAEIYPLRTTDRPKQLLGLPPAPTQSSSCKRRQTIFSWSFQGQIFLSFLARIEIPRMSDCKKMHPSMIYLESIDLHYNHKYHEEVTRGFSCIHHILDASCCCPFFWLSAPLGGITRIQLQPRYCSTC